MYPGLLVTAAAVREFLQKLNIHVDVQQAGVLAGPVFLALCALAAFVFTSEAHGNGAGLASAALVAALSAVLSHSATGSINVEAMAVFALVFAFFLLIKYLCATDANGAAGEAANAAEEEEEEEEGEGHAAAAAGTAGGESEGGSPQGGSNSSAKKRRGKKGGKAKAAKRAAAMALLALILLLLGGFFTHSMQASDQEQIDGTPPNTQLQDQLQEGGYAWLNTDPQHAASSSAQAPGVGPQPGPSLGLSQ